MTPSPDLYIAFRAVDDAAHPLTAWNRQPTTEAYALRNYAWMDEQGLLPAFVAMMERVLAEAERKVA